MAGFNDGKSYIALYAYAAYGRCAIEGDKIVAKGDFNKDAACPNKIALTSREDSVDASESR